jgi:hypothetical protein
MALKYSSMLELGSKIPDFKLLNALDGDLYSPESLHDEKAALIRVIFIFYKIPKNLIRSF